ncbi:uncharacterized protein LOC135098455 [Scylla paramamosain]|uniref:uncharacterized protein LOC135098455 n=1 Tax=Scylla paramamosain TaxID=85552 RepID=UPI0030831EE7
MDYRRYLHLLCICVRRIVGATLQHITYTEFLPSILGQGIIEKYGLALQSSGFFAGYDININAGIANSVSSQALKFVASLLPNTVAYFDEEKVKERPITDTFYAPFDLYKPIRGERVNELSENLNSQLKEKVAKFVAFSVAIDESTDITDIAQLAAVFIRGVDENMQIWTRHSSMEAGLKLIVTQSNLYATQQNVNKPLKLDKDETGPNADRLFKVRPVLDHLQSKFRSIPMQQMCCIDEMIVPLKGNSYLKQYIPSKPHKWGFKVFALCDTSGILNDLHVYDGPLKPVQGEPDLGPSSNIVLQLARTIPVNANHLLYHDNWFTSPKLMAHLATKQIYSLGTEGG